MGRSLSDAVSRVVGDLCAERGISGQQLARSTGIPQSSVQRKLAGLAPFQLDDLPPVCRALQVGVPDLVGWALDRL